MIDKYLNSDAEWQKSSSTLEVPLSMRSGCPAWDPGPLPALVASDWKQKVRSRDIRTSKFFVELQIRSYTPSLHLCVSGSATQTHKG
jgi:hypothetical protein